MAPQSTAQRRLGNATVVVFFSSRHSRDSMKKLLMTAALAAVALGASAQTWPDKAVTMVVPFPPGGSTDQVARAVAPLLTEKFKQSFLVDNKAGATGTSAPPS